MDPPNWVVASPVGGNKNLYDYEVTFLHFSWDHLRVISFGFPFLRGELVDACDVPGLVN